MSVSIKAHIVDKIKKAVQKNFKLSIEEVDLEYPPEAKMGDLSFPCFSLVKEAKFSPEKIAKTLAEGIRPDKIIEKVTSVGPYLNFFIQKPIWFKTVCDEILTKEEGFGRPDIGKKQRVMVEFSSPNTNKPQHLGLVRNNVLGDSLSRILSASDYKVIRANLINDRGIHISKSMLAYQKWGEDKTPESEKLKGDHFVGNFYVLFGEKLKENSKLLDEAHELLKKWEEADPETLALWQKMTRWALDGFKETYKKLGIEFDKWYFESETYKLGKSLVMEALKKGICYRREDNAIEIDLSKYNLDKKVLIRSDGTSVYITQDLGLAKLKFEEFKLAKSIYVVASEQDYHFKVLFKVLELLGFDWAKNCHHLSYGMVWLPEGVMKSRLGTVVEADDIIREMEKLAEAEIRSREPDIGSDELRIRAHEIGLGALKFYLLKFTPGQDINFDPKVSISFEGATGPYVQYAHARIQSILKKSDQGGAVPERGLSPTQEKIDWSVLGNDDEMAILKLLFKFPEVVESAAKDYNPANLATYLLDLAQAFNKFYHTSPVLQAETRKLKKARLGLVKSVAIVLASGLRLLGIEAPEKM